MPEAESELVAGYMTEYSGFRWSLYFLAEYSNMVVVASVATTLFLGGWLRPFASVAELNFLDFFPVIFMLGVTGYCVYRIPKQSGGDQGFIMAIFAGICFLLALPLGVGQGVGGRLTKGLGARALLVAGIIALAVGEALLATQHSLPGVLCAFAVIGFGIGLASAPPNALLLRYVDERRSGAATGLLTMLSSTGAITALGGRRGFPR